MKIPKVSVIMSVYNSEEFLDEAIQSILNQTFDNFELIIINDCSTDNSLDIIKKYQVDERIILIDLKRNLGRAKARNKGLKIARGKYIAILDSDDIALEKRLKIQFDFLEKNKDIFLVGSNIININEKGYFINVKNYPTKLNVIKDKLVKNNCFCHSSVMFKSNPRYFYRENFPYSQDYDLYLRMLSDGKKMLNIKEPIVKYRINPRAISWTKNTKQRLFAEMAKEFYQQRAVSGEDEYRNFNASDILDIDIGKSLDRKVLLLEIKSNFKMDRPKAMRHYCLKYFHYYGFLNPILIYYFISFLNKKFLRLIKKLK